MHMSFPMINFKITNAEVSDQLKTVTEHKLATLEKYIGNSPAICDVEFEKITNHHQQGDVFRLEVNLEIGGRLYRAEATTENFEKSIDDVRSDLEREIQSASGKRETLWKKGARRMKEMMRFGS